MKLQAFYKKIPGRVRKRIEYFIKRMDHGEFFSPKLRKLYKKVYNIEVGKGSYGCFDTMQFPEGTRIGNYCSIMPRVYYLFSNHPMDGASTHPLFYNKILGYVEEDRIERARLTVGNDVWIGAGTTITRGCTHIALSPMMYRHMRWLPTVPWTSQKRIWCIEKGVEYCHETGIE